MIRATWQRALNNFGVDIASLSMRGKINRDRHRSHVIGAGYTNRWWITYYANKLKINRQMVIGHKNEWGNVENILELILFEKYFTSSNKNTWRFLIWLQIEYSSFWDLKKVGKFLLGDWGLTVALKIWRFYSCRERRMPLYFLSSRRKSQNFVFPCLWIPSLKELTP